MASSMFVQPKWAGKSVTIVGVVMAALSIIVQFLAPMLGLDLTVTDVENIQEALMVLIVAGGGLFGSVMAVWGRFRSGKLIQPVSFVPNAPAVKVVLASTSKKVGG